MIFTTGGRASGATSTRSRPRSTAAARASSTGITPNCSPSFEITRTGLMRICRFTRVRGCLLLPVSIARNGSPPHEGSEKADPESPGIRIVVTKLADHHRGHKTEPLAVPAQPARHHCGVVLEAQQPLLGFRPGVEPALVLQRHQRLQIVAHDPGE